MTRTIAAAVLTAMALVATAAPAMAKPDPICTYVPDLEGNLYGPVCVGLP